ncbi:MAG: TIGR03936 family radical SAM-associated protein [Lachnospiraceae bacterium]|nr:TIGR03936 family radical SAM-associated protein [Lachnospiraceae bacterium]
MKIRIRFKKHGPVRFIGHLDTMRFIQKLIRRAGIPAAYSEGFSPHQKLSFAQALGVGVESEGEYFDLELNDDLCEELSSGSIIERLNACSVEGIEIKDCVKLPDKAKNAMASVFAADYHVRIRKGHELSFDLKKAVDDFNNAKSAKVVKKTKKTSRDLELKDLVYELKTKEDALFMRLNASSANSVKPGLIMEYLCEKNGCGFDPLSLMITRLDIYDTEMKPLSASGIHF